MFKKAISIFLIFAFIIIMTMTIYAETETPTGAVVKLTKIEGLKNSLGVQKLDIRVNGLDGYRIVKETDFESIYFAGEEILKVDDLAKFKVNTCVLTTIWKWYSNLTSLVEGENEIILEIKKDRKIFKMIVTVVVEYPETTATPEATATNTDIITPTPMITGDITPVNTEITTTPTSTANKVDVDKMPDTGDTDSSILIIFGIFLVGSAGTYLFLMRLKNAKNN